MKYTIKILFLSLIFFLGATSSVAFAQSANWMANSVLDLFKNAPWKLGTVRAYRAFYIGDAGYDSDIYYGFQNQSYPDFSFTVGPAFQWFVPLKKLIIFDSYQSILGNYYFKNEKERGLNFRTNNQIHFLSKKFYGKTGISYDNLKDRFTPELIMNIRHEEFGWNGLVLWQFSKKAAAAWQLSTASLNYTHVQYGSIFLDQELNRRESFANMFIYFQPTLKFRFYIKGQIGLYNFKFYESKFKDSRSYAFYGGLEFTPEPRGTRTTLQGSFNLGYKYLDPESSQFQEASDIVGSGYLTLIPNRWLSLRVFYNRDFSVSIFSSLLHYLSTTYGGGLTFNLNEQISFSNQFIGGHSQYPLSPQQGEEAPKLEFATLMSSLGFRINRNLYISVFGTLNRRVTYPGKLKFNRQFIGFSLTYGSVPGENILPIPSLL